MNKEEIKKVLDNINNDLSNIDNLNDLNEIKNKYMSKKGIITELSSNIKNISNEDKKEYGLLINELRNTFNTKYEEKLKLLEDIKLNEKLISEKIDITLPATKIKQGSPNILEKIIEEVEELLMSMGYDVVDGPEIEEDKYNFELLNIPKGHPARDAQDTFYLKDNEILLRSQTSPVQARTMLEGKGEIPIRMICPGKTYRRDDDDATHSHQFMQCEGLVVDKNITLADLKGTLEVFARKFFGEKREIRLRPSYFPFTEPSVEVDISCHHCGGKGCAMCKGTGWIEILGAGMVNPKVLDMCGFDSKEYQGFAFGIGIERVAMLKYGIDNIRDFYNDDLRFLNQFQREE